MDAHSFVTLPNDVEAAALQMVARYLMRAGTEAASKLLACDVPDVRAELWASLSDSFLHGAALCNGITCSLEEVLRAGELARWTSGLP